MSIRNVLGIHEWPKWHDTACEKCGESVPSGHTHFCDKPPYRERTMPSETEKLPERETVTLTRDVTSCNYDGTWGGHTIEVVDAVIEWPNGRPPDRNAYTDYSSWVIARRLA